MIWFWWVACLLILVVILGNVACYFAGLATACCYWFDCWFVCWLVVSCFGVLLVLCSLSDLVAGLHSSGLPACVVLCGWLCVLLLV